MGMRAGWRDFCKLGALAGVAALFHASVPVAAVAAEGDVKRGERVFKKCKACHEVGPEAKNKVGPQLNGVVGRKAASIVGFKYSKAMQESELTWTESVLSSYLKKPKKFLKGTKMNFVGLRRDKDIVNILAYLSEFDADGNRTRASE